MFPHAEETARAHRYVHLAALPLPSRRHLNLAAVYLLAASQAPQQVSADTAAQGSFKLDHDPLLVPRDVTITVPLREAGGESVVWRLDDGAAPCGAGETTLLRCPAGHDPFVLMDETQVAGYGNPALYTYVATLLIGEDGDETTYWLRGMADIEEVAALLRQVWRALGLAAEALPFVNEQCEALELGQSILVGIDEMYEPVSLMIHPPHNVNRIAPHAQA